MSSQDVKWQLWNEKEMMQTYHGFMIEALC